MITAMIRSIPSISNYLSASIHGVASLLMFFHIILPTTKNFLGGGSLYPAHRFVYDFPSCIRFSKISTVSYKKSKLLTMRRNQTPYCVFMVNKELSTFRFFLVLFFLTAVSTYLMSFNRFSFRWYVRNRYLDFHLTHMFVGDDIFHVQILRI